MKLLSWNCQGIGNLVTVRAFKKLISLYHPDFIFLMETKKLKKQCSFLSYVGAQYESCSTAGWGKSGGLIFLWNPIFKVEIKMHDFFYIDALITSSIDNTAWRCSGIYGFPQHQNKFLTCDTISNLSLNDYNPNWLIFGDLNMILHHTEKMGGNPMDLNTTQTFRDTINVCNLMDLGFKGDIFTWANNQDEGHIKCRLDRFFANQDWISFFPNYSNSHLTRFGSDHNPLLLDFSTSPQCMFNYPKPKRFEQV
jgi:exonuclease III